MLKPSVLDLISNDGPGHRSFHRAAHGSRLGFLHNPPHEAVPVRESYICIQELKASSRTSATHLHTVS